MIASKQSMWPLRVVVAAAAVVGLFAAPAGAVDPTLLEKIKLPPGFNIEIFANNVENARSMARGDKGTLFVGTRQAGNVCAIIDSNNDFHADQVYTIARGLNMPNGVAFRNGSLYLAEVNRVLRFDEIENHLTDPPKPVIVNDSFPQDKWHGWKFIAFGPDKLLYVPVGAPCNVCEREDERFASIMRMQPDGSDLAVFAHGVRNTVGFDWHPQTKTLWFTENGRDWLGDERPPDELNRAPRPGLHFGFPYLHGKDIRDPEFGDNAGNREFTLPAMTLDPHCAALGMRFYTGRMFPEAYRGRIFIAEHGSWNRSELPPTGYRVTSVRLDGDKAVAYEPFATGWLEGREPWGRPVDVLQLPDGSLLVSDDYADAIYRITYQEP